MYIWEKRAHTSQYHQMIVIFSSINAYKAFRRRSRYHVDNQSRNEHYKLYEMITARYMTGFWNVIKANI